ncbi:MAG: FecR family protein, partial [Erythrobacter sp.]
MPTPSRILIPLSILLSSTSAFAQSAPWTVSEASGEVVVRTSDGDRAARRGTTLGPGHQMVTGSDGNAVIVRDRQFVTVRPNTQVTIPQPRPERSVVQIIQDFGSALFDIGKERDPHFGVDTPYLAAVVKGTRFSITVTAAGTSMQVTEGLVEASTLDGGARDLVEPGEIAIIAADDRLRLNVEGDVPRQIDSPARGVSTGAPAAQAQGSASVVSTSAPGGVPVGGVSPAAFEPAVITVSIGSSAVDLDEMTGGLVRGEIEGSIDQLVADLAADEEAAENDDIASGGGDEDADGSDKESSDDEGSGDDGDENGGGENDGAGGGSDGNGDDGDDTGDGEPNGGGDDGDDGDGGDDDNGHGNDDDGHDDDNPGQGGGNGNGGGDDDGDDNDDGSDDDNGHGND